MLLILMMFMEIVTTEGNVIFKSFNFFEFFDSCPQCDQVEFVLCHRVD